ncbi:baseplate J/gp47 family protein [Lactobacillus kullabergensis]|uniref:baseplate J/gp47 family protein n=1 Tax=Lactobacillus kullabergensis TaxID=1218493 RepID=UPI0022469F42|nr:baseplate J/gp47 family protein [Lactobacillus kullabergensis]MCX0290970.1 baseplate J/gp47 family protein [Lactobacillus kullabergensis]
MTPDELAENYMAEDYDYWLGLMLDNVPDDIDQREGSVIYDALAPAAMVMAQQSLSLANIVKQTYVKTAQGQFLDYRAQEHGTARYAATQTEVKAKFLDTDGNPINNVQRGDQFASIGETPIFYTVQKINDDLTGELTADDPGTAANSYIGQVLPVTSNDSLSWAEITEIVAPARDEETDDHLRDRLLRADDWIAYGGNITDYLAMLSKISEVGAGQVYPVWNGAGTVKLVIVDNNLMPASVELVKKVKNIIDPTDSESQGYGLAPIDHQVTVVAPTPLTVNISATVNIDGTHGVDIVKAKIKTAIEEYFKLLKQSWNTIDAKTGRGYSQTIYRSKILSQIMMVDGVINASVPTLNGADQDIALVFDNQTSQLPVLGEVKLDG